MHPRPDWFKLLKYAVLKLIVCVGVIAFTFSGYLIPIILDQIQVDFPTGYPMIALVLMAIFGLIFWGLFGMWLLILDLQYNFVNMEDKFFCGLFVVFNLLPAFVCSILVVRFSGPIELGQVWHAVGQCFLWLMALLTQLHELAMVAYWLALVCAHSEAQSSGGTVDGQPMAVVVIPGTSTTAGTHGTRAAPGSAAAPGSTAASSAT